MGTEGGRWKEVGEDVRCSCCGRTRSWTELCTFTTDLSSDFDLADGTLTQTVLYCRDDSDCRGTAQTLRLIPTCRRSARRPAPSGLLQRRVMRRVSV